LETRILKNKFIGAMVGSALGDAIGELAFYYPEKRSLLEAVSRASQLRYTDDTAMRQRKPAAVGAASAAIVRVSS